MSSYSTNSFNFPPLGQVAVPEPAIETLFIPRMDKTNSETNIKAVFEQMGLGAVDRVDFVPLAETHKDKAKFHMAFVHMREWYRNPQTHLIHESINANKNGQYKLMVPPFNRRSRLPAPYWVLMKCHSPIPKANTDLTLEQLLEQNRVLAVDAEATAEKLGKLGDPLLVELNSAPPARMDNPVINIHQMATNNRLLAERKTKMEEKLSSYVEPFQFMQLDECAI